MQIPAFSSVTPDESASVRKRWSPFDHDVVEKIASLSSRYSEVLTFPAGGYHASGSRESKEACRPMSLPQGELEVASVELSKTDPSEDQAIQGRSLSQIA